MIGQRHNEKVKNIARELKCADMNYLQRSYCKILNKTEQSAVKSALSLIIVWNYPSVWGSVTFEKDFVLGR